MKKQPYPTRITVRSKGSGRYTAQVTVQTPSAGVYHGPARFISDVGIGDAVNLALSKAEGHQEAADERRQAEKE